MESKSCELTEYNSVIAVMTGDLVGSKKHSKEEVDAAISEIARTAEYLGTLADAHTRFTRFRGDGWQIVLGRAGWAMRAALIIIADMKAKGKAIETRISVGIGRYESLGTDDLSDASGQAFITSGRRLDDMPSHRRLVIEGGRTDAPHGVPDHTWQIAIFDMAEWIASRWSQPQAEAMAMALRFDWQTQDELAQRLGITRQAMHARLRGAGFQAMENALHAFEQYKWETA